jgi:hypothetical protein
MLRNSTTAVNWRKAARDWHDSGQGVCEEEEMYNILNLKYE